MKKGFTLIELLGVMVILSVLLLLIMPNIINSIKKANEDNDSVMAKLIYSATKKYIESSDKYKQKKNNTYCITIKELVEENLIDSPVKYGDSENIENTSSVRVTYSNKWNYEIVNKSACTSNTEFTCARTNSSNVTKGYVPKGKYEIGDEYICKVNASTSYHFYILSVNGNKVSLIADRNLDSDGTLVAGITNAEGWSSSTSGPIKVYEFFESHLTSWTNIPVITRLNFIDQNKNNSYGYKGINVYNLNNSYITSIYDKSNQFVEYSNVKARLPMYNEMNIVGCTSTNNSCPLWAASNISSTSDIGYWLMDSATNENDKAYIITGDRSIATQNAGNNTVGIRPVIELTKNDLE